MSGDRVALLMNVTINIPYIGQFVNSFTYLCILLT